MSQMNLSQLVNLDQVQPTVQITPSPVEYTQGGVSGGQVQVGDPGVILTSYAPIDSQASMFFALSEIARGVQTGLNNYDQIAKSVEQNKINKAKVEFDTIDSREDLEPFQKEENWNEFVKGVDTPYLGRSWATELSNAAKKSWTSERARTQYYEQDFETYQAAYFAKHPDQKLTPEVQNLIISEYLDSKPLAREIAPIVNRRTINNTRIKEKLVSRQSEAAKVAVSESVQMPDANMLNKWANDDLKEEELAALRANYPIITKVIERVSASGYDFTSLDVQTALEEELKKQFLDPYLQNNPNIEPEAVENLIDLVKNTVVLQSKAVSSYVLMAKNIDRVKEADFSISILPPASENSSNYLMGSVRDIGNSSEKVQMTWLESLIPTMHNIEIRNNNIILEKNGKQIRYSDLTPAEQRDYLLKTVDTFSNDLLARLPEKIGANFKPIVESQLKSFMQDPKAGGLRVAQYLDTLKTEVGIIQRDAALTFDEKGLKTLEGKLLFQLGYIEGGVLGTSNYQNPLFWQTMVETVKSKAPDGTETISYKWNPNLTLEQYKDQIQKSNPDAYKRLDQIGFFTDGGETFNTVKTLVHDTVTTLQAQKLEIDKAKAKSQEEYEKELTKSREGFSKTIERFRYLSGAVGTGDDFEYLLASGEFKQLKEEQGSWAIITEGYTLQQEYYKVEEQLQTATLPAHKEELQSRKKLLLDRYATISNQAGFEIGADGQRVSRLDGIISEIEKTRQTLIRGLDKLNLVQVDDQGNSLPYALTPEDRKRLVDRIQTELLNSLSGSQSVIQANPITPVSNPFDVKTGKLSDDAIIQLVKLNATIDSAIRFPEENLGKVGTMFTGTLTRLGSRRGQLNTSDSYYDLIQLGTMSRTLKDISLREGSIPIIHNGDFMREYALIFGNVFDNLNLQETITQLRNPNNPSVAFTISPTQLFGLYAASIESPTGIPRGPVIINRGQYAFENVVGLNVNTTALLAAVFNQTFIPADPEGIVQPQPSYVTVDSETWSSTELATRMTNFLGQDVSTKQLAEAMKKSFLSNLGLNFNNMSDDEVVRFGTKVMIDASRDTDAIVRGTQFLASPEFGLERLSKINPNASKLDLWFGVIGAFADVDTPIDATPGLTKRISLGPARVLEIGTEDQPQQVIRLVESNPAFSVPGNGSSESFSLGAANNLRRIPAVKDKIETLKSTYPPVTDAAFPSSNHILGSTILDLPPTPNVIAAGFNNMFKEFKMSVSGERKVNGKVESGLFFDYTPGEEDDDRQNLITALTTASNSNPKTFGEFLIIADKEYKQATGNTDSILTSNFTGWNAKGAAEVFQEPGYTDLSFLPSWRFVQRSRTGIPRIAINDTLIGYVGGR